MHRYSLEDLTADVLMLEADAGGAITVEMAFANESVAQARRAVALSEQMEADGAFARQLRRRFIS